MRAVKLGINFLLLPECSKGRFRFNFSLWNISDCNFFLLFSRALGVFDEFLRLGVFSYRIAQRAFYYLLDCDMCERYATESLMASLNSEVEFFLAKKLKQASEVEVESLELDFYETRAIILKNLFPVLAWLDCVCNLDYHFL